MIPLVGSPRQLGAFIGRWGGDPRRKSSAGGVGGLEGWPVRRRTGGGEWFRGGQGGVVARAGRVRRGLAVRTSGGWRLRGVEFDDKLEALDIGSNGWKI